MGWMFVDKGNQSASEHLKEMLTFESESGDFKAQPLDIAIVKMRTAYVAMEHTYKTSGKREVFAAVILLDYRPYDYYNFGYKDMDETMGPYETECPQRILELLTETDNKNALEWRRKCVENINKRKAAPALKKGATLVMETALRYGSIRVTEIQILDAKRRVGLASGVGRVRIPSKARLVEYGYKVVSR